MTRQVFDEQSLERFRAALDGMRTPGAYEPGKWCMSPISRRPDMLKDAPKQVVIRDITMRTVEQMAGVDMPKPDRHRLLRAIAGAGVSELLSTSTRLGTRNADEMREDMAVIREVAPDCVIQFHSASKPADFDFAKDLAFGLVSVSSNYIGEAAALNNFQVYDRIWRDEPWDDVAMTLTAAQTIARSVRLVSEGKQRGLRISAGMGLVAYQSDAYISEFCGAIAEAGADDLLLADSNAAMSPEGYAHVVRIAKEAAPKVKVAVHPHDLLGLAIANAMAAVRAGAETVETSVNGYHLGFSQAETCATAVAVEALYGIPTGLKLDRLYDLARTVEEVVKIPTPIYQPVVGRQVFALGWADPFVEEAYVDPLLHKSLVPEVVGNRYRITPTASFGRFGMWRWLDELGIEVTKPEIERILLGVLGIIHSENRPATDNDVRRIAAEVTGAGAS